MIKRNTSSCGSNTTAIENSTGNTRFKCHIHIRNHVDHTASAAQCRIVGLSKHWTSMEIEMLYFVREWFEEKGFASVMASSRHLTSIRRRPYGSIIHLHQTLQKAKPWTRAQSTSQICKVGTQKCLCPIFQRKRRGRFRSWSTHGPPRSTRPITPDRLINHKHNRGQTDHGLKHINHGNVSGNVGWRNSQDSWGQSKYHSWHRATLTLKDHSREMDTTDTTGEHHDSHRTFSTQICQFLLQLWIFLFSSMIRRAGESFATSACAKQKPVHCAAMLVRTLIDKHADIDYHAVPPPEYQAGGDSKRDNLCQQDSQRITRTRSGTSSSRRPVATEDPSSEEKIIFIQTLMENSTSRMLTILQRTSSRRARRSTSFHSQVLESNCARFGKLPPIFKISRSTLPFGANSRGTACGPHLGLQRITKTSKGWRWIKVSQEHKNWYSPYCRTGTHFVGQELRCWVIQQQSWSVFSDSTLCVGVSNRDPCNN